MEVLLDIAEFRIRLSLDDGVGSLPTNYAPFVIASGDGVVSATDCLLDVSIKSEPYTDALPEIYGQFDDLGYRQEVYQRQGGGYFFRIFGVDGAEAATMESVADFKTNTVWLAASGEASRTFAINNTLMIAFAFAAAHCGTLMMHSSVVKRGEWGYMFLGKSGTGKSTHSSLWLKHIEHTHLLNDDNPVLRIHSDRGAVVYGSPWSGKTPCYRQEQARVGALVMLEQKPYNKIRKDSVVGALGSLLCSCSIMIWDKPSYDAIMHTISAVIAQVGVHHLECLPDEDAARVCEAAVGRN